MEDIYETKNRTSFLLKNSADVAFAVCKKGVENEPTIIHAHKVMMAHSSPVFYTMFYGSLTTEKDLAMLTVEVDDIDSASFSLMIHFVYDDKIELKCLNAALEVYKAGKKYMIDPLIKFCIDFVVEKLQPENAAKICEFAKFYDDDVLVKTALKIIRKETRAVLSAPDFLEIDVSTMIIILEQSVLEIKEIELFNALEALFNAKLQKTEGSFEEISPDNGFRTAIKKIDFLQMTTEQYVNGPMNFKLLLPNESQAILRCLVQTKRDLSYYPNEFVHDVRKIRLPSISFTVLRTTKGTKAQVVIELNEDITSKTVGVIQNYFSINCGSNRRDGCFYFSSNSNINMENEKLSLIHSRTIYSGSFIFHTSYGLGICCSQMHAYDYKCFTLGRVIKGMEFLSLSYQADGSGNISVVGR